MTALSTEGKVHIGGYGRRKKHLSSKYPSTRCLQAEAGALRPGEAAVGADGGGTNVQGQRAVSTPACMHWVRSKSEAKKEKVVQNLKVRKDV